MAVTYRIDGNILFMILSGTYVPDDVPRQFVAAINDPACPEHVHLVVDVTASGSLATRPTDDIRRVAEALGPYAARIGGRCAVVASEDVHFGLSRMGAVYSQGVGVETQVFRTLDDAFAWLDAGV